MNLRRIFFSLIIVVCFSRATENQIPHLIVHHIVIRGNQITKEHIIRREIQHQVASPFDSLIAIEDRNRIDNLGIFSEVTFFLTQSDNGSNILTYLVVETWRYIPFPV
ncbi:MAG: POTRA domain-containing protein, partial [Nitrosopumilus sp.]